MKILALELFTPRGSLVWLDVHVKLAREWANDRKNSAALFENLDNVTKQFGAPEIIVVGLGPGSYAGTRIAISAAIGLQVSSRARLIGFPSICVMECDADKYCAIGDARRKSFFFARIRGRKVLEGPTLYSESGMKGELDKLDATMPIFSSDSLPQFERVVICYPPALVLARGARKSHRRFFSPPLEPIYLREPHITVPKMRIGT